MKQLFILPFLFLTLTCFSQIKFGAEAGLSIVNLTDPETADGDANFYTSRLGYEAGFFVEAGISEKFGLKTAVHYSNRGAAIIDVDRNTQLHYMSLPVVFKYDIKDLFVLAGPEFAYMIGNNLVFDDVFDDFDYGVRTGFGYNINETVGLELTYYYGLKNNEEIIFRESPTVTSWQDAYGKNRSITVSIKYNLN